MAISPNIFRQYDIRGIVGKDLDPRVAHALGRAFAAYLSQRNIAGAVAVGRDNRPSGKALRDSLVLDRHRGRKHKGSCWAAGRGDMVSASAKRRVCTRLQRFR